jgi:hypothetical protein
MSVKRTDEVEREERLEVAEEVLRLMAEGRTVEEAVKGIARERGLVLTAGQVRKWMAREEGLWEQYLRARKLQGSAFAEEAILVARESTNSTSTVDKTLIETLKWAAARANPAEYGDRQVVEHAGSQQLSIKVVEDDAPVRNQQALAEGMAGLALAAGTPIYGQLEKAD